MTRFRACFALCVALTASLSAAHAEPPPNPSRPVPLRIQLHVVDACTLERQTDASRCATAHQRSDPQNPAAPQVQALTPPPEGGSTVQRTWQTLTF